MEIVFLGTGGGRINLIKQVRATGGMRINSRSANIHVDPGPGALVHCKRSGQNPLELDAIIVTHNHIDHVSDAMVLIEGMSGYGLKKRGILIGSRHVLEGNEKGDRGISTFHQSKAETTWVPEDGERKRFETGKGYFEIEAIAMDHDEPTSFGFKLQMDGSILGYVSDTNYFRELGEKFSGCDTLIINCIKPESDEYKGHLNIAEVIEILKIAKPKSCVITHFGLRMLKYGPNEQAQRIEKESGVKTLAARDGMRLVI